MIRRHCAFERLKIGLADFEKATPEEHTPAFLIAPAIEDFCDGRDPLVRPWRVEDDAVACRHSLQPRFIILRKTAGDFILNVAPRDDADPKTHTASFTPRVPRTSHTTQVFYCVWKGRQDAGLSVSRLVLDSNSVERVALFPSAIDGDVIAWTNAPDVHRTLPVHVANVDLVIGARRIIAHDEISKMAVQALHGTGHPS